MKNNNRFRWVILGTCSFTLFSIAFIMQSVPPILRMLIDELQLSHTEAGTIMSMFIIPTIFVPITAGLLVDRYSLKMIGIISISLTILGTIIVATSNSYWALLIGRLISGIGGSSVMIMTPKAVSTWFAGHEMGLAMGIFMMVPPLGLILSLNVGGAIAYQLGWHTFIWITAITGSLSLILFSFLFRDKKTNGPQLSKQMGLLSIIKGCGGKIWLVGASWGLANAATIAYFTFGPDFFINHGRDISQAGLLASFPMWGALVIGPLSGFIIDRIGKKQWFVITGCLGIAVTLLLISRFPDYAFPLAIISGIFVAIQAPAIFSLPSDLLPEHLTGIGFGIVGTLLGIGQSCGPIIAGLFRDITGNYAMSFIAMFIFAMLGVIPMLLLKTETKQNIN